MTVRLPITALVAVRNEARNIEACLRSLAPADRVIVLDSESADGTPDLARGCGAEVVAYRHAGGYPKKRQWALDNLSLDSRWILLVDADERIPDNLWSEIADAIGDPAPCAGYLIRKGFHFMGRRFRFGGFSHSAVLLFQRGKARFERLADDLPGGFDMEVHERLLVDGPLGALRTPLVHEDFKGLDAYLDRHRRYAAWEAGLRVAYLDGGSFGAESVASRLMGDVQERRRWLKKVAVRAPFEPLAWFLYHYVFRLGFLEGRPGWMASRIRMSYIREVRSLVRAARVGSKAIGQP